MAVFINNEQAVHQGSDMILVTEDVCLTGEPPIPITYHNVAYPRDAVNTAKTVFINGHPACHQKSRFDKSYGDEAGDHKGVHSGTIQGEAEFISGSPDTLIEGVPAVRRGDLMVSNHRNTEPEQII